MARKNDPADPSARILAIMKTKGPRTAAQIAARLGVTAMAVRQHLYRLCETGMVSYEDERRPVGRPARIWQLTEAAAARFPDSHSELALTMIEAARAAFGEAGLAKLVQERTRSLAKSYQKRMPDHDAPLQKRVAALTKIREDEGYMAEYARDGNALLLIENHCPICAAAQSCTGICDGEIDLFRMALGKDTRVERTEHIVSGARRCVYRIEAEA